MPFFAPSSRRPIIALGSLLFVATLLVLHGSYNSHASVLSRFRYKYPKPVLPLESNVAVDDPDVANKVQVMRGYCEAENAFEKEFGRTNIRMSRAYEGSHHRVRKLLHKALRGEELTISALGGSVTFGHSVWKNEGWFYRFGEWFQGFVGWDVHVNHVNGAWPATGSDYFSFCFPLHIPMNADLVLVELAINDEGIPEHVENMENLLRGLLDMPSKPAVILVEALAFSSGGMGGGGGRMHLPVAQYYDVPVINHRHPLASHFARYPDLIWPYFSRDYWGNPDKRHINSHGHRDLGRLVASFVQDVACAMFAEPDFAIPTAEAESTPFAAPVELGFDLRGAEDLAGDMTPAQTAAYEDALLAEVQVAWPEDSRSWREGPKEGEVVGKLLPGLWMGPHEYGQLPRMRVLEGWNPDPQHVVPHIHPTCFSTRSPDPTFRLTPIATDGWEHWAHPEHLDKPYLISRTPGATVSFKLSTEVGIVKMYALKSKTFGLGTIECWVDDDTHRVAKIEGYWDNGDINIGRFTTIRDDVPAGEHTVTCKVLHETADPGGGHEFRMISIMSL